MGKKIEALEQVNVVLSFKEEKKLLNCKLVWTWGHLEKNLEDIFKALPVSTEKRTELPRPRVKFSRNKSHQIQHIFGRLGEILVLTSHQRKALKIPLNLIMKMRLMIIKFLESW